MSESQNETQTQEERIREALLRKGDVLLRCLRKAAEDGVIDTMEAVLPELKATMSIREFPTSRRQEIDDSVRTLLRNAYMRSVEVMLYQAEHGARDGDTKARNENLAVAKDRFVKALRQGAGEDFRAAVEKRVQACLMTSAPGVDRNTKEAAARRLESRDRNAAPAQGTERRRAIRYGVPTIRVDMDGVKFDTADWSQVGLLLDGYVGRPPLKVGDRVTLRLSCAGIESPERQSARVVRVFREKRQIALEFSEISTIILDLITAIRRLGLVPRPK